MGLAIASLALAIVAIVWMAGMQLIERPRLRIELSPWSAPNVPWKFLAIRVLNLPMTPLLGWLFNRRSAEGCTVNIAFSISGEQQPRFSISGRWSAHPEPIRLETRGGTPPTVVGIFDPTLVPGSYQLDIPATGAWEEVVVAVRRESEVYAFSAESYAYENWKRPGWRLDKGDWDVDVAAASAHARAKRRFRLRVGDGDVELLDDLSAPTTPPTGATDAASPEAGAHAARLAEDALASERQSAENLSGRGAWLIGFVGVVLALVVGLGGTAAASRNHSLNLGDVGGPVFAAVGLLAVFLLVASALTALRGVQPRKRGRMPTALIRDIRTGATSIEHGDAVVARFKVQMYEQEAQSNDERGQFLLNAFRLLVVGLLLVSALAVILFLHQAKVW